MQYADEMLQEKLQNLWQTGRQALDKLQKTHREHANAVAEEVAKCLQRHSALEAESKQLRQMLACFAGQVALLGACMASPSGSSVPDSHAASASLLPIAGFPPAPAAQPWPVPSTGSSPLTLPEIPASPPLASQQRAPLSLAEALGVTSPHELQSAQPKQFQPQRLVSLACALPSAQGLEPSPACSLHLGSNADSNTILPDLALVQAANASLTMWYHPGPDDHQQAVSDGDAIDSCATVANAALH